MSEEAPLPAARAAAPPGRDGPAVERRFAVSAERLLQDWREAHARALAYLESLGLAEAERGVLATEAVERALGAPWEPTSDAVAETLRAVQALIRERHSSVSARTDDPFLAWRLDGALAGRAPSSDTPGRSATSPIRDGVVCAMPKITRRAMVPEPFARGFLRRRSGPARECAARWRDSARAVEAGARRSI